MCNPMWEVNPGSVLRVDLHDDDQNGGITGELDVTTSAGTTVRRLTRADFPLVETVGAGEEYDVLVNLDRAGRDATVTVVATVSGPSTESDTCVLQVTAAAKHAEDTVMAAARGA